LASIGPYYDRDPRVDFKLCFNYLWRGSGEYKGLHLARWKRIALPKRWGGWGLKDVHLFGKSLAARSLWNFITKPILWRAILIDKYVSPDSINDWVRKRNKSTLGMSNQWKYLTKSFLFIKDTSHGRLDRVFVRLGANAIMGCNDEIFLLEELYFFYINGDILLSLGLQTLFP
jgi:hypothetical protein